MQHNRVGRLPLRNQAMEEWVVQGAQEAQVPLQDQVMVECQAW